MNGVTGAILFSDPGQKHGSIKSTDPIKKFANARAKTAQDI